VVSLVVSVAVMGASLGRVADGSTVRRSRAYAQAGMHASHTVCV
jgi:hypothetical protein